MLDSWTARTQSGERPSPEWRAGSSPRPHPGGPATGTSHGSYSPGGWGPAGRSRWRARRGWAGGPYQETPGWLRSTRKELVPGRGAGDRGGASPRKRV